MGQKPAWRGAHWLGAALVYVALAVAVTWPLVTVIRHSLPGYPNVDALDTSALRGLVSELVVEGSWPSSQGAFFPTGYPVATLAPNVVDHLLGAPFALALPFPLGDSLWWLLVLVGNGLCGHHLGRTLGGGHRAGLLVGAAWMLGEPSLREANLLHAPQAILWFPALYLASFWRATAADGRARDAVWAGLFMALTALTYWYAALFVAVGSVPLAIARARLRRIAGAAAVAALLALPVLGGTTMHRLPVADGADQAGLEGLVAVPPQERMEAEHGSDPLGVFRQGPLDRSNLVPLTLLAAALLGARRREARPLLAAAGLGWVFLLGPYPKWGEEVVSAVPLPFQWLGELHPALDRLSWPERWGLLMSLGLVGCAAWAPRPALWALLVTLEVFLRSGNAPLQVHDLSHQAPWRALEGAEGAVVELPLGPLGPDRPKRYFQATRRIRQAALHRRFHGRDLVNPLVLPPGLRGSEAWREWVHEQPLLAKILVLEGGKTASATEDEVHALRASGVAALALNLDSAAEVSPRRAERYVDLFAATLGAPDDRGAYLVWWLARPDGLPDPPPDPQLWRDEAATRPSHGALDTLIDVLEAAPAKAAR